MKNINFIYKELDNKAKMERHIVFAADAQNIRYAENLVDDISEEFSIGSELYGNILVSVVEAVNNAIIHGNKLDKNKKVELRSYMESEMLNFKVTDQGEGFDFSSAPDPTSPENIEKPHGRGIFLMKNLTDEFDFNEKGNEVILKFKIQ